MIRKGPFQHLIIISRSASLGGLLKCSRSSKLPTREELQKELAGKKTKINNLRQMGLFPKISFITFDLARSSAFSSQFKFSKIKTYYDKTPLQADTDTKFFRNQNFT